jgi:hypothetical protein
MSNIFGWSYPPGCHSVPGDESQAVQLHDDRTLKGYGKRGHGLHGKDADLNPGGQIVVDEAWWIDDGIVRADVTCYASLVPGEDWTEEQLDSAYETVAGSDQAGEWDGDYWVCTYKTQIKYESNLEDEGAVIAELYDRITNDEGVKAFVTEMIGCSNTFDNIDKGGD